jgi:hypothetical protein
MENLMFSPSLKLKPIRVGCGHQCRTGKDTTCRIINEHYGGILVRISEPVYDIGELIKQQFEFIILKKCLTIISPVMK